MATEWLLPFLTLNDGIDSMIKVMGTFDFMFSIREYLAGVHEAPSQKLAEIIAEMQANEFLDYSSKQIYY